MVTGAFGALVIAMFTSTATAAGSTSPFAWTGPLMIVGYVAAAGVVASFVCGIRRCRFPLARREIAERKPREKGPVSRPRHLPDGSSWAAVDDDLKKYEESHERQPGA